MNRIEAVKVIAAIRALCPGQHFDEHTPEAWALVLDDIRYTDAQQAVRTIYRDHGNDQEWGGRRIEADDIIREVRRIRARRLDEHGPIEPPPGLPPDRYVDWLRNARKSIADGKVITQAELPTRDTSAIATIDKRPA